MTYSPLLLVHICAGIVGVLSGFTALFARKGSELHRKSGVVFAVSMMFMALGGAYLALMKAQRVNVVAGVLTFYLVTTAWLTVSRRLRSARQLDVVLLLLAASAGVTSLILAVTATNRATAITRSVFAVVALLFAAGDLRMLVQRSVSRAQRLARHLWRMCFALFVAAGSFFLGTAGDPAMRKSGLRATLFPAEVRQTHLNAVPVLVVALMMINWLWRVGVRGFDERREGCDRIA